MAGEREEGNVMSGNTHGAPENIYTVIVSFLYNNICFDLRIKGTIIFIILRV